ncbi:MAG: hypothetical protein CBC13_00480 [Planctomycetia bacterium TMED53]|nr:MAG: hypothetical protein CBC13_00480 [Planctomycetia bacterium TMED53]
MTQFYKQSGFTLARANTSTRWLLTLFLLSVIGGCFVAALQYSSSAGGFSAENAREWVLGNEDDFEAEVLMGEKTPRELLAFIHDHIFSLGMLLFVVLHLVELTPWSTAIKVSLAFLGFGSLAGLLFSPLAIASGSNLALYTQIIGGTSLLLTLTLGSLACLDEMWWAPMRRRRRGKAEPPPSAPLFPKKKAEDVTPNGGCPLGYGSDKKESGDSSQEEPPESIATDQ